MHIRQLLFAILGSCAIFLWVSSGVVHALDLQNEIHAAESGAAILIPSGEYDGPLVIEKPISIIGEEGVVIRNRSDDPALSIQGEDVEVSGLTIIHESESLDSSAIYLTGKGHRLHNLSIVTTGMGMTLDQAHENVLRDIEVEGPFGKVMQAGSMSARQGNGIDLFRSHANRIEGIVLRDVQDGIYIEHSEQNVVRDNHVSDSRYGYHLMFTENTTLSDNTAQGNISGAMVMGTKGTRITDNDFSKQAGHVHSQGLMLYDVTGATVTGNRLEQNLVGLYIESSENNWITDNDVYSNYIGIEMLNSQSNIIERNEFVGNVISARAKDSAANQIIHNYWDDHLGFDLDGDRISEIPYDADWLFPAILAKKPAYQIFAGSPGLLFLKTLMGVHREAAFSDAAPLMERLKEAGSREADRSKLPLIYYSFGLLLSAWIAVGGRKR